MKFWWTESVNVINTRSPCPLKLFACTSYLVPPPSKVHACCCCCCYDKVWYLVTELAQVPTFRGCWQVSFLRWFLPLSVPVSTISHPRPCSLLPGENFPASIFFPNPPSSTRPRPFFPLLILDESSSVVTTQCRWHSAINIQQCFLPQSKYWSHWLSSDMIKDLPVRRNCFHSQHSRRIEMVCNVHCRDNIVSSCPYKGPPVNQSIKQTNK